MSHGWKERGLVLALGAGWGMTQPLGKIATSSGHPAFGLVFWQLVTCILVLGLITLVRRRGIGWRREHLGFFVMVALLGTVVPNFTFYTSAAQLPSGIMSIIISTIPLIAFPINLALKMDHFDLKRAMGLALGLTGVLMIALPQSSLPDRAMLAFLPIAMIGPLCYALENTYVAHKGLGGLDAISAMLGVSCVAACMVGVLMLVTGQGYIPGATWPDAALAISSALHGLLYATFVWLAARTGAVFASQSSYVTTVSGVTFAMLFLGERPSPWIWAAMVVLLAGMTLVKPRVRHIPA
ncbi:DMT family transporter [Stagnihabitans tardus]|uniref:EamA family transporter n=1 Tax=Stagnihabitans tardus TaxID=2699202 RepID=A0AAE4Y9Q6_9RHOB|nr:DMT family transporter [Stagnihabitans tardus]NBZ87278.1 EamA family transporter [Stagnihabitans tardus]